MLAIYAIQIVNTVLLAVTFWWALATAGEGQLP